MRLFGSDRISKLMDRMGLEEGEVIQHKMISNSIERAQKKVEENNFGIRKRLLEYDDVMNSQREVIYKKRRHALYGERVGVDIANMMYDTSENVVQNFHGDGDYTGFTLEIMRSLSVDFSITEEEFRSINERDLIQKLYEEIIITHKRRAEIIAEQAFPVIKDVYMHQSQVYKNIVVPISDGTRRYHIVTNLENAYRSQGVELMRAYEKTTILATIDEAWKEHLREMDDLKQSVQNASYEQKDPLLIYKFESFELFKTMLEKINKQVVAILMKGHIPIQDASQVQEAKQPEKSDMDKYQTSRSEGEQKSKPQKVQPIRTEKKVGRF